MYVFVKSSELKYDMAFQHAHTSSSSGMRLASVCRYTLLCVYLCDLSMDDLVRSENCFFAATGITDGELVDGVKYYGNGARTHSLVMRSASGTVREIATRHRWEKLMRFSNIANGKE